MTTMGYCSCPAIINYLGCTMYMTEAHNTDQGGINTTLMRSCSRVWKIQGTELAKKVIQQSYACCLNKMKLLSQVMAPLLEERIGPAPIYSSVAVDLFGPLIFRDMVNKRVTGKGWGAIFVCQVLLHRLLHIRPQEIHPFQRNSK